MESKYKDVITEQDFKECDGGGDKIYQDIIFEDVVKLDHLEGRIVFRNCAFTENFILRGDLNNGEIEIIDSKFMGELEVHCDTISRGKIKIKNSSFFKASENSTFSFNVREFKNSTFIMENVRFNKGAIEILRSNITESLLYIKECREIGNVELREVRFKKACIDFEGSEVKGDRAIFKNIYAGDSAMDFFRTRFQVEKFVFNTITFVSSNLYFHPDKKVREGKYSLKSQEFEKCDLTAIHGEGIIFSNLNFKNSKLLFGRCSLKGGIFVLEKSHVDGSFHFENMDGSMLKTFKITESMFSGISAKISNFDQSGGEFELKKTTFDSRFELNKIRTERMLFRDMDINSNVRWNIGDVIVRDRPQKLFVYGDEGLDYKRTMGNLNNALELLDRDKYEEEYNYIYYWIKRIEEKSILSNAPFLKGLIYRIHYIYYGRMTDYLMNWKKVISSIRKVILGSALIYSFTGLLHETLMWIKTGEAFGEMFHIEGLFDGVMKIGGFFLQKLYFSCITFTTVGYGDIHPDLLSKPVACVEGLLGIFLCGALIATLGKKFNPNVGEKYKELD